jgi:abortive infection bacteriophage resistance protein
MSEEVQLKPPKTFEEQLEILQSRGLKVGNYDKAIEILKRVNYYRFTAYTLTFKQDDVFFPGTTFELIYRHYDFDARLRNLLMEIIEYIEISFRTHIAYLIAHKYGALGHEDSNNFKNEENHKDFMNDLQECISSSKDPFVLHHKDKYKGKFPVWVALEVLTFSTLSKLYKNLKLSDQKKISRDYYGSFHPEEVSSWLFSLSIVRNRCAHYSRLFNQTYQIKPRLTKEAHSAGVKPFTLFATIYVCKFLITDRHIWRNWVTELEGLIVNYPEIDLNYIGFTEDWHALLTNRR